MSLKYLLYIIDSTLSWIKSDLNYEDSHYILLIITEWKLYANRDAKKNISNYAYLVTE